MSFRDNLQTLRAQRNITQEQLAILLGVPRQSISAWESERSYPEMDKLLMICDLFGCTLDDLVLGDVRAPGNTTQKPQSEEPGSHDPGSGSPGSPTSLTPGKPTRPMLPRDITGYDAHRRAFSFRVSLGIACIIGGVALGLLLGGGEELPGEESADLPMIASVFLGLAVGLGLLIPAGIAHGDFKRRHPYIADFYTDDDRSREGRRLGLAIPSGIALILLGVFATVLAERLGVSEGRTGAPVLLGVAAGVFVIVFFGMRYGLMNIDGSDKKVPQLEGEKPRTQDRAERIAGAACGVVMVVATIVGLVLLFTHVPMFWLSWVFGGLVCAIINIIAKAVGPDEPVQ